MSHIFPLNAIPKKMFPDAKLSKLLLRPGELVFSMDDSDWAIEDDISLFYGPGDMVFYYSGDIEFQKRAPSNNEWSTVLQSTLPDRALSLEMISRYEEKMVFQFREENTGYAFKIIISEVIKIIWTGEKDDYHQQLDDD